jgi:hypothetical protein
MTADPNPAYKAQAQPLNLMEWALMLVLFLLLCSC